MKLKDYEIKHIAAMRALAPECMVLLKKKGDFPISAAGRIALYGSGARKTIKGGTGSGDVNARFFVTVEQGLKNAGFEITTAKWLDAYDQEWIAAKERFVADIKRRAREQHTLAVLLGMGAVMPEPAYDIPLDGAGDTAVYVLSRNSGEGNDRKVVEGDVKLTPTEIRDILACQKKYAHFMLVLNVGGVIDLSPVMAVENILILSQLGAVTGDALADVLLGKAYPSGKLTTTWAKAADIAAIDDFGELDETRYREGIYVGYRYYGSVGKEVCFPFGHGLSYGDFALGKATAMLDDTAVTVDVPVKNIGMYPGREVVQLYVTAPWGKLDQPYQRLAAFAKTGELVPGAEDSLKISFNLEDIASYDQQRAAYILEAGDYILRLGTSSAQTEACALVRLDREVLVRQLSNIGGTSDFVDWKPECTWADETYDVPVLEADPAAFAAISWPQPHTASQEARRIAAGLSDEDLCHLTVGNYGGGGSLAVIGAASTTVAGAAGESYGKIGGIPKLVMADGPAGLRLAKQYTRDAKGAHAVGTTMPAGMADFFPAFLRKLTGMDSDKPPKGRVYEQYCTAMPIGTALAQSFNEALWERCGDVVGAEMERFGVHLWLAPAFNIHRSPLCGRNFEYCSEDPLVSGLVGAGLTRGVQAHPGRGVTVKHFCVNNQEFNRYQNDSILSERALREIYMKNFEICIRRADPASLMTSYNLLNGIHTSEREDLLKTFLRDELGWGGMVMTDWVISFMKNGKCRNRMAEAAPTIGAGNDVFMPGSAANYKQILAALRGRHRTFSLTRAQVEYCAAHVIDLAKKLG